jgi:hypothetical protein
MMRLPLEQRTRSSAFWLVVVAGILSASAVVAGAGPGPGLKDVKDFLGLWQGVDSLDGSPVRLSLSDIEAAPPRSDDRLARRRR